MKKLSTYLFLILFSFSTSSFADDIRDFQIEGMSIGDSLLDYMSKDEIKKAEQNSTYMKDKKYIVIFSPIVSEIYDDIQITYQPEDSNYLIHSIDGKIEFEDNIKGCKKKMKEIVKELKSLFKDAEIVQVKDEKHEYDKSGKSLVTSNYFYLKSGDFSNVWCTDWSNEMFDKHSWIDDLSVTISSKEFKYFLIHEAYP